MDIIKQYGTPLKLTYLPRISENIRFVQATFNNAMERFKYNGKYTYCYCTKSSHFSFVMEEAMSNQDVHIETSSSFDIPIVDRKSTRLNSSHLVISYAVFCLKKKKK